MDIWQILISTAGAVLHQVEIIRWVTNNTILLSADVQKQVSHASWTVMEFEKLQYLR